MPDGSLRSRAARLTVGLGYLAAVALGIAIGPEPADLPVLPYLLAALVAGAIGLVGYLGRCRKASAADRARLQWIGWGVVLAASFGGLVVLLDALLDWPDRPGMVTIAASVVVPGAFAASTVPRLLTVIDRVLVRTVVVVGLLALVEAVYLFVVVGLGRVPEAEERSVLVLSMLAAGLCAVLAFPARHRLEEVANQRVYGERHRPDDAIKTFAGRMSRAVPMDELLLQLAESLKKSLALTASEVWTGSAGTLDRAVSVPDRGSAHLSLRGRGARGGHPGPRAGQRLAADLDAGVCWRGVTSRQVRAAVVAHLGELLGLIVVERRRPTTRRSPTRTTGCSPSWPARSAWPCTTSVSTRPSRRHSSSSRSATRSWPPPASASSPRPTSPGARSSATSTTGPSSTWSPSR